MFDESEDKELILGRQLANFYFVQLDAGKGFRVMGSSPGLVRGPSQMGVELWCHKWMIRWMEWASPGGLSAKSTLRC